MPKLDDVRLGVSPLTDSIYMGTVSKKDAGLWLQKRNAMSDFCGALLTWIPAGTTRTIRSSAGPWYQIEVREVPAQPPLTASVSSENEMPKSTERPSADHVPKHSDRIESTP